MADQSGARPDYLAEALAHLDHAPQPDWLDRAACRGVPTSWFFPGRGYAVHLPISVCATCAVRLDCALANAGEPEGIFGGLTGRQRRVLRKAMADAEVEVPFPPRVRDHQRPTDPR